MKWWWMLQKEKSATTSSRSNTSKTKQQAGSGLEPPVQYVKGVGPRLGTVFASRGIKTVRDLLTFFPRAYEDRTRIFKISELVDGSHATVAVQVTGSRKIPTRNGKMM